MSSQSKLFKNNLYNEDSTSDIGEYYLCSQSCCTRNPYKTMIWNIFDGYRDYNSINLYRDYKGEIWYQLRFNEPVYVSELNFGFQSWNADAASKIDLYGSNDAENWILLEDFAEYLPFGVDVSYIYPIRNAGWYRFYKCYFEPKGNNNNVSLCMLKLRGYPYQGQPSYNRIEMPAMESLSQGGYSITTNGTVTSGSLFNITKSTTETNTIINFDASIAPEERYAQYTLPISKIVNIVNINFGNADNSNNPNHFRIMGSNDEENWHLLHGWHKQVKVYTNMNFIETLGNNTAYKYYRLYFIENFSQNTTFNIRYFLLGYSESAAYKDTPLLPQMQANKQDGFELTASSEHSDDYAAWKAFDGDNSSAWDSTKGVPCWLIAKLTSPQICNVFSYIARQGYENAQSPKDFVVQGSNDGDEWETLLTVENETIWGGLEKKSWYFENDVAYQYYRFYCSAKNGNGNDVSCAEMMFSNKKIWTEYIETKDTVLMPPMTANPQSGYTLTASSTQEGNVLNLFKQNGTADWWVAGNNQFPCYVTLESETPLICNLVKLQARPSYQEQSPKEFYIQASNDGDDWIDLFYSPTQSAWSGGETRAFYFENTTPYLYYRLYGLSSVNSTYFAMSTMTLYNRSFIPHPDNEEEGEENE